MVKRLESYFHWRLTGNDKPAHMEPQEEQLAQKYYNEMMVRYIVGYSNFTEEEVLRTGFSKLLTYPEFQNPRFLSECIALFENAHSIRLLLKECSKLNQIKFWMGDDLANYCTGAPSSPSWQFPMRSDNKPLEPSASWGRCGCLTGSYLASCARFQKILALRSRNIYKFKITFRQPHVGAAYLKTQSQLTLLEDKRSLNT